MDVDALAAMGLMAVEPEPEPAVECFPDNWQALHVFQAMTTQWRVTDKGFVSGLHYEALPGVMDMMGVRKKARGDLFNCLREMEDEALKLFNKKNG